MVNSTRVGGGVAELLTRIVPLLEELGLRPRWEVIAGDKDFFEVTKAFHNALHGSAAPLPAGAFDTFRAYSDYNRSRMRLDSEFMVLHDPQPAGLIDGRVGARGTLDLALSHRSVASFGGGVEFSGAVGCALRRVDFFLAGFRAAASPPAIFVLSGDRSFIGQEPASWTRRSCGRCWSASGSMRSGRF